MGIEQINDAIIQLDQQTQQNAAVANQTRDIALQTDKIEKLIVANADEKEQVKFCFYKMQVKALYNPLTFYKIWS